MKMMPQKFVTVLMFASFIVSVKGRGDLSLKFVEYYDRFSCDNPGNSCDFYFKVTTSGAHKSTFTSKTYDDLERVYFQSSLGPVSNPLTATFSTNGTVFIKISVYDEDGGLTGNDDFIRDIVFTIDPGHISLGGPWKNQNIPHSDGHLKIAYKLASCAPSFTGQGCNTCATDYYRHNCSVHCHPNENYTCTDIGEKVCTRVEHYPTVQSAYLTTTCNCTVHCVNKPGQQECDPHTGNNTCLGHWVGTLCDSCDVDYYGTNCSVHCVPVTGNYTCDNSTGTKVCSVGKTGANCDQCAPHYYTPNCSVYCVDSPGQYNCTDNGDKVCEGNWQGAQCDKCVDGYYGSTCNVHCLPTDMYACDGNGEKVCQGNWTNVAMNCSECLDGYYGDGCDRYCIENHQYTCSDNGTRVCKDHWAGSECQECSANYFGSACNVSCVPNSNYSCAHNGSKQCLRNREGMNCTECKEAYFGVNCTTHCDTNHANFTCSKDGTKVCNTNRQGEECEECLPGYFTAACNVFCQETRINSCDNSTGALVCKGNREGQDCSQCKADFYGNTCETFCAHNATTYTCDLETGEKLCNTDWYGTDCEVMCTAEDNRYNCSNTGDRICFGNFTGDCYECKEDHYGDDCAVLCVEQEEQSECDRQGVLRCLNNFQGPKCDQCTEGWGGKLCDVCTNCDEGNTDRVISKNKGFTNTLITICVVFGSVSVAALAITIRTSVRISKQKKNKQNLLWVDSKLRIELEDVQNSRVESKNRPMKGKVDPLNFEFTYDNPVYEDF